MLCDVYDLSACLYTRNGWRKHVQYLFPSLDNKTNRILLYFDYIDYFVKLKITCQKQVLLRFEYKKVISIFNENSRIWRLLWLPNLHMLCFLILAEKKPSEASFHGAEYISYNLSTKGGPIISSNELLTLYFKTQQPSGLLFYSGKCHQLALVSPSQKRVTFSTPVYSSLFLSSFPLNKVFNLYTILLYLCTVLLYSCFDL